MSTRLTSAPLPDICRNRHGGNENSELANLKVHSRKEADRALILKLAEARGEYGVTLKEAGRALGKLPHCISGRFTELKAEEMLEPNGLNRDDCAVLIVPKAQKKLF